MKGVSVVVPSIGRSTLHRTLRSVARQLGEDDEVIVVGDPAGDVALAEGITAQFADERWTYLELEAPGGDRGYAARMLGDSSASRGWLHHVDDDDCYAAGAMAAFRSASAELPTLYRMRYATGAGGTLWREPVVRFGNVGTPMFLTPRVPEKLGRWQPWGPSDTGGDMSYISETIERFGGGVVWDETIVALIRPE